MNDPHETPNVPETVRVPPGKKRCPRCNALNGVRTLRCVCGHAFEVKRKPGGERKSRSAGKAADGGEGDPLASARDLRDAVAGFCGRYAGLADVAGRIEAVQSLRGRLTLDEHREIENLAAATGGIDLLLLVAREIMANRAGNGPSDDGTGKDAAAGNGMA